MAFKIGDIVMRLDGDGRPHKIVDITVHYPLNSKEDTFFQYHYEDGGIVVQVANTIRMKLQWQRDLGEKSVGICLCF